MCYMTKQQFFSILGLKEPVLRPFLPLRSSLSDGLAGRGIQLCP